MPVAHLLKYFVTVSDKLQFTLLLKVHYCCGDHLLAHRSQLIHCLFCRRDIELKVCKPITFCLNYLTILHNANGKTSQPLILNLL